MDYKKKLEGFNGTLKYINELKFLKGLIGVEFKTVLDFGCGIGTAVNYLNRNTTNKVFGCEKTEHSKDFFYSSSSNSYDTVYFMHSIAHIENPTETIRKLKTKRVVIITPNADWIMKIHSTKTRIKNYKADETVRRHFDQIELIRMIESAGFGVETCGQFGENTDGQNERIFLIANRIT